MNLFQSFTTVPVYMDDPNRTEDELLTINFPLFHLGDAWGNPDLGQEYREPVRSDRPVLVLAGELDPRTPVENGREIVKHLDNGKLIVVPGAGHDFDLFGSPRAREVLKRFLAATE